MQELLAVRADDRPSILELLATDVVQDRMHLLASLPQQQSLTRSSGSKPAQRLAVAPLSEAIPFSMADREEVGGGTSERHQATLVLLAQPASSVTRFESSPEPTERGTQHSLAPAVRRIRVPRKFGELAARLPRPRYAVEAADPVASTAEEATELWAAEKHPSAAGPTGAARSSASILSPRAGHGTTRGAVGFGQTSFGPKVRFDSALPTVPTDVARLHNVANTRLWSLFGLLFWFSGEVLFASHPDNVGGRTR